MDIIRGVHNIKPSHSGCVLTIGTFDGLHYGHQMLLTHLKAKSEELGQPSLLVTFEPQPREYFQGEVVPARLTRFREKVLILEELGIDRVLCIPFNERTRITEAEALIQQFLIDKLDVGYVVVGDDFRFGKGARGDYAMLKQFGDRYGFGVGHMGTLRLENERVSSTRVREVLAEGDFQSASKLLGSHYSIMGRVIYGRQLARELGAPTANIRLQRYRAALSGVYAVEVEGIGDVCEGVANIGLRPTVDGKQSMLEVHLFDFVDDIYGKFLKVTFLKKLREEKKFDGLDSLRKQIAQDIANARDWFVQDRSG